MAKDRYVPPPLQSECSLEFTFFTYSLNFLKVFTFAIKKKMFIEVFKIIHFCNQKKYVNKSYQKIFFFFIDRIFCSMNNFSDFVHWIKKFLFKKKISAIKRVVKHEKMAIYDCYPLYSWEHLFNEQFFQIFEKYFSNKTCGKTWKNGNLWLLPPL